MCGIVAVVAKGRGLYGKADTIFEELLYADGLRGMDSTGAFVVSNKNQVNVLKQAVDPGIFTRTKSWDQFKNQIDGKAMLVVGHNRKATVGEVISKNAHPFVDKDIVLVHNGWIGNHKDLDSSVAVDSEAIITALDKHEKPEDALKSLFGAFALAWYNHKTKKFYLARNTERPLFFAHSNDHMFVASEQLMLEWILKRNEINVMPFKFPDNIMWEVTLDPFKVKGIEIPKKDTWKPLPTSAEYRDMSTVVDQDSCGFPGDLSSDPAFTTEFELEEHTVTPELERLREMARQEALNEGDDGIEAQVKAWSALYPPGKSVVLFKPVGMHKENGYYAVRGYVWQPGKALKQARCNLMEKDADLCMDPEQPLVAHVDALYRRDAEIWYSISRLIPQKEVFKDVDGNRIGLAEWQMICNKLACDSCARPPKSHQPEFTSVVRHANGTYSITCADCVDEHTTPVKAGENGG